MTYLLWAILGVLILLVLLVLFVFWRWRRPGQPDQPAFGLLQNQLNDLRLILSNHLQHQATSTSQLIKEVTAELTKVGEATKQVGNVAEQIKTLQDILKNPKQRGILGEYYLETMLKNVLPPGQYQLQYGFKDGSKVDAAIFVKDKIVPIDSKFSLENYERDPKLFHQDLKNRIDETAKYVRPEENTFDFAFMFIPAEAIYYDLLVNKDWLNYAWNKRVIVVSPNTFYHSLQIIMQGLKALQIEESAKDVIKRVGELGRHIGAYEDYMRKLGTHLGTSINTYNTAYKELAKIDKDVLRITGQASGVEPELLEKPDQEDEGML